jgi:hypothetical protein
MSLEPEQKYEFSIRMAVKADVDVLGQYGARLIPIHHAWDPLRFVPASPLTATKYASYFLPATRSRPRADDCRRR